MRVGVSSRRTGIGSSSVFPHTGIDLDNSQPSANSWGNTAQPYLMEIAQLFDDDAGKLSHTMTAFVFHLRLLHTWETFTICTVWEYGIGGKFLMNHSCLLPRKWFLSFPSTALSILFPLLLGDILVYLEGLPYSLGGCDTRKEAWGMFMKPWDIFETSVIVFTQEQDNQNKAT